MDYEKKYKEAIERAKEIIECSKSDTKEVRMVLSFFPELKESEGEKIRKAMIKYFTNGKEYLSLTPYNREDYIAWLEKQGEPKPWSEEDEAIYYGIIETEQYMLDVVNGIKKFDVGNISIKEDCTRELNWLRTLKDRVFPQPKQEWSEEDEKILNSLISSLARIGASIRTDSTSINYTFSKEIDWLKSLRPQSTWKPTEQQMKVLNEVINFAADHGTMRWNDYIYNVLKGLREQLKKLRDE